MPAGAKRAYKSRVKQQQQSTQSSKVLMSDDRHISGDMNHDVDVSFMSEHLDLAEPLSMSTPFRRLQDIMYVCVHVEHDTAIATTFAIFSSP